MKITLERPVAATEKGKRNNNEDCIYPLSELANAGQRLFMVCDGVGGAEKGEVASALACDSFQTFFDTFLDEDNPSEAFINKICLKIQLLSAVEIRDKGDVALFQISLLRELIGDKGISTRHYM